MPSIRPRRSPPPTSPLPDEVSRGFPHASAGFGPGRLLPPESHRRARLSAPVPWHAVLWASWVDLVSVTPSSHFRTSLHPPLAPHPVHLHLKAPPDRALPWAKQGDSVAWGGCVASVCVCVWGGVGVSWGHVRKIPGCHRHPLSTHLPRLVHPEGVPDETLSQSAEF